jgi:hypothetical protein
MNNIIQFPTTLTLTTTNNPQKKRLIHQTFNRAYSGPVDTEAASHCINNPIFTYCIGIIDKMEVGYLVNRFHFQSGIKPKCHSFKYCELAVVKEKYRSNGALKKMLEIAIIEHRIKGIKLDKERAEKYRNYYASLGFTQWITHESGLVIVANPSVLKNTNATQKAPVTMPLAA